MSVHRTRDAALEVILRVREEIIGDWEDNETRRLLDASLVETVFGFGWQWQFEEDRTVIRRAIRQYVNDRIEEERL